MFGFAGGGGPAGLQDYALGGQGAVTGTGLAADPFRQQTVYGVPEVALVTQTTTYVAGAESFTVRWDVRNVTAAPLTFKALAAADFFFEGSDAGTGVFTDGPPRFVGGTNPDTGRSGGFAELPAESLPWSHYEALAFGAPTVWGEGAGGGRHRRADVHRRRAGHAVGQRGRRRVGPAAHRSARPRRDRRLRDRRAQRRAGGAPAHAAAGRRPAGRADRVHRHGARPGGRAARAAGPSASPIVGANPATQQAVTDAAGNAVLVDPGTSRGADTVVAFVDLNGDGVREASEPQASALASFADDAGPACTVRVAGDRSLGRREPLVVARAVRGAGHGGACAPRSGGRRLAPVRAVAAAGSTARLRVGLPARVRRRYAGRR